MDALPVLAVSCGAWLWSGITSTDCDGIVQVLQVPSDKLNDCVSQYEVAKDVSLVHLEGMTNPRRR